MRSISVRLRDSEIKAIHNFRSSNDTSVSDVIRAAVAAYLDTNQQHQNEEYFRKVEILLHQVAATASSTHELLTAMIENMAELIEGDELS